MELFFVLQKGNLLVVSFVENLLCKAMNVMNTAGFLQHFVLTAIMNTGRVKVITETNLGMPIISN
jgi:hypothetical protein